MRLARGVVHASVLTCDGPRSHGCFVHLHMPGSLRLPGSGHNPASHPGVTPPWKNSYMPAAPATTEMRKREPQHPTRRVQPGGLGDRLSRAVLLLSSVVDELAPDRLSGEDAAALYGSLAGAERLAIAGKTLLGPRIATSNVWRDSGHRDAAGLLADLEGVSTSEARRTLDVGRALSSLPGTEEALRDGSLSKPKLTELTGAGLADPAREAELLNGAAEESLASVRERCRRARATASTSDPLAAVRSHHAKRHFTAWTDAEGAFCYQGRDTADRGAKLLAHLGPMATALRRAGREAGRDGAAEPEAALRADALFALVTGDYRAMPKSSAGERGATERPPPATVIVRVDLDSLRRGRAKPGEQCELDGQGPIPVPMARDLMNDAFIALCFSRAGDIRAVSHLGRTVKRKLRSALIERDRTCVVPGCGVRSGLEIDHLVPFAEGGPTELDNIALLCHHHHFLKSYEGWTLERTGAASDGRPTWSFEGPVPFGKEPGLGIDTPEGRAEWLRQRE